MIVFSFSYKNILYLPFTNYLYVKSTLANIFLSNQQKTETLSAMKHEFLWAKWNEVYGKLGNTPCKLLHSQSLLVRVNQYPELWGCRVSKSIYKHIPLSKFHYRIKFFRQTFWMKKLIIGPGNNKKFHYNCKIRRWTFHMI